jgi:hypothetical protein
MVKPVDVAVESSVIARARSFAGQVEREYGIRITSLDFSWIDVSTYERTTYVVERCAARMET